MVNVFRGEVCVCVCCWEICSVFLLMRSTFAQFITLKFELEPQHDFKDQIDISFHFLWWNWHLDPFGRPGIPPVLKNCTAKPKPRKQIEDRWPQQVKQLNMVALPAPAKAFTLKAHQSHMSRLMRRQDGRVPWDVIRDTFHLNASMNPWPTASTYIFLSRLEYSSQSKRKAWRCDVTIPPATKIAAVASLTRFCSPLIP